MGIIFIVFMEFNRLLFDFKFFGWFCIILDRDV